ncbi:hypothetical protein ACO1KF_04905 [Leptospira interrogans serovar Hardjo-prajitno]|uniref:Uncharacterized protein n=1 Tax=Leptospira interrogans serovar Hardjo str. Norma TaxID=1279460 RepID=A0A0M3TL31_LEPIR|nr:hypothetical protein [Leptospira interrogans]ALE38385.1 hypothetical protein G436_1179 [Leptospira interrogans serovar Hardjo str. Norma]UPO18728.1 hypothetical protein MY479_06520 [Leptospira interrogans]UQX07910.1 hypothetical protein MY415_04820 [Leptospira interrogans]
MRGNLTKRSFRLSVSLLWSLEVTQRLASMVARQIVFYNRVVEKLISYSFLFH